MIELTAAYHELLFQQIYQMFDSPWFIGFTMVVTVDIILNIVKPFFVTKPASFSNAQNLIRNGLTYVIVTIVYPYLSSIGMGDMADLILAAFIYQYLVWCLQIWTEMGWFMPAGIREFVNSKMLTNNQYLNSSLKNKKKEESDKHGN